MQIKSAEPCDIHAISAVHVACWRDVYTYIPAAVHRQRSVRHRKRQWAAFLGSRHPADRLYAIVADCGKIVGMAATTQNTDPDLPWIDAELHAAYVLREHRGGRIGSNIMRRSLIDLYGVGARSFALWSWVQNPMHGWYRRVGWVETIRRERIIAEHSLPEIGYSCYDAQAMIGALDCKITSGSGASETEPRYQPASVR